MTMAEAIYLLCALTSTACALLLYRSWLLARERLLLWSVVCFVALALNNAILFADLVVFPETDLLLLRNLAAFVGVTSLLAGLIVETT
jgi:hypothetical protein